MTPFTIGFIVAITLCMLPGIFAFARVLYLILGYALERIK